MMATDAFEVSEIIDETNRQQIDVYFNKLVTSMNCEIERILENNKERKPLLQQLFIHMAKVEVPYLYFLPDVSNVSFVSCLL